ncbi:MAG: NAD(P) transhydrogenase subunit alpha [Parvularculaceae bacterium]|nr:NAD(P) transhydrogenase subunit alpha [Parvularculaceae bacterium]
MAEPIDQDTAAAAAQNVEDAAEALRQAAESAEASSKQLADASEQASSLIDQIIAAGAGGPSDFIYLLGIFVLAIFVGYYVVWSVTPALHTPLMSVTNAISSVVIVGALIAVGADLSASAAGGVSKIFGFIAITLASVNIFGGFLVTQRMLAMYKKKTG